MLARLTVALVIAALGAALLAGCGSSSSTSSASTPSSSTPTSTAAATHTTSTPAAETEPVPKGATVKRLVAACRATIAAVPKLEAPVKEQAERTCEAAEHGSVKAALAAADRVCEQVVQALPASLELYKPKLIRGCKARSR